MRTTYLNRSTFFLPRFGQFQRLDREALTTLLSSGQLNQICYLAAEGLMTDMQLVYVFEEFFVRGKLEQAMQFAKAALSNQFYSAECLARLMLNTLLSIQNTARVQEALAYFGTMWPLCGSSVLQLVIEHLHDNACLHAVFYTQLLSCSDFEFVLVEFCRQNCVQTQQSLLVFVELLCDVAQSRICSPGSTEYVIRYVLQRVQLFRCSPVFDAFSRLALQFLEIIPTLKSVLAPYKELLKSWRDEAGETAPDSLMRLLTYIQ